MGYTSLKHLYSEQVHGIKLNPLGRQLLAEQDEVRVFVPGDEYVGGQTWASYGIPPAMFENEMGTGQGRGEYSVACLLWGFKSKDQVDASEVPIIQGTNASFDVLGKDGATYEVKEIGKSVKTGVEGREALSEIIAKVTDFLSSILNAYATMDDHGKDTVNHSILNSEVVRRDIVQNSANAKYFDKIKNTWKLDAYLKDVLTKAKRGELARGILLSKQLKLSGYVAEKRGRPDVIFSFQQLAEVLNEIAARDVSMANTEGELNVAVQDIYQTIAKHYKVNDSDSEKNFFEKEAENIDRDLTQKQCKEFKKCTNEALFKKVIRSLKLNKQLEEINRMTVEIVEKLFPGKGLFLVDKTGFDYVPHGKLSDYIEFETISGSSIKIRRKKEELGVT